MLSTLWKIILVVLGLALAFAVKWALYPYLNWKRSKRDSSKEKIIVKTGKGDIKYAEYREQIKKEKKKIDFSLVVPAYNEETRLTPMLEKTIAFLESKGHKYEIIIINDASKDKTTEVAMKFTTFKGKPIDLKVIEYEFNKGKGGAVRIGMLTAIGEYVLMLDADGATEIEEFDKIVKIMKNMIANYDKKLGYCRWVKKPFGG